MLSLSEIREMVAASGLDRPVPTGLSNKALLRDDAGRSFKIRSYPSSTTALQRLLYLDVCRQAGIRTPDLAGAWDRYLVFDYPTLVPATPDETTLTEIGRILGRLNTLRPQNAEADALLEEPADWLDDICRQAIIPPGMRKPVLARLNALRPPDATVVVDYWDAMPHNFGWQSGDLLLIDEKHIRDSFPGVGLVKLMLVLPQPGWLAVRRGYALSGDLDFFDRSLAFLTYFYFLTALHFYSLSAAAGRVIPTENPRLMRYRRNLIERTPDISAAQRMTSDLRFFAVHWRDLLARLNTRLRGRRSAIDS